MLTGVHIVFELGKWRYAAQPLAAAFYRLGNGPIALATFLIQLGCTCRKRLLLPACILQTIVAALGLFVLAPCVTNLYYLYEMMSNDSELLPLLRASPNEMTFLQIAVILTAASALACILATGCGSMSALRSAHLLNADHRLSSTSSAASSAAEVMTALDYEQPYSTLKTILPRDHRYYDSTVSSVAGAFHNNLYWSADENPYYYHQTAAMKQQQHARNYYGHPYQIESGFYGYSLAGTHRNHSLQHSGGSSSIVNSASQTRIGHIFNAESLR